MFLMFRNRANAGSANFYALLAWSGAASIAGGIFFGSYAGDLFSEYIKVPFLTNLAFKYRDGMSFYDKPLTVLFVSMLLGAIQLWYGHVLKFITLLKTNMMQAITDELPWLLLLAGFFGWAVLEWIAGLAGLHFKQFNSRDFFILMWAGALLILARTTVFGFKKGFIQGITGPLTGAWELYGISSYLSNLLSYARLLALGLSSGIIANVFNQLGFDMIRALHGISPVLVIFGVAALLLLHAFSLILGGFGAFVHALRLQFVEFFGQFLEGGGKEFTPLSRKGSHYTVK